MKDFLLIEKIRDGTYGKSVYKGINKKTAQFVALKIIGKNEMKEDGIPSTAVSEISSLKDLNHPNIVKLENVIYETPNLYLIFEFVDFHLKEYMDCLGPCEFLDPTMVKSYLYQINSAISYCHGCCIIHRDLKPQNLLINRTGIIKVADFTHSCGFLKPLKVYTEDIVILWYMAPELVLGGRTYSCPVDIWAMGCIFAEMISKKALFQGESDMERLWHMFRLLGNPSEEILPGVSELPDNKTTFPSWPTASLRDQIQNIDDVGMDLLRRMLWFDPHKRITAKEMSQHPYFKDVKLPLSLTKSHTKKQNSL